MDHRGIMSVLFATYQYPINFSILNHSQYTRFCLQIFFQASFWRHLLGESCENQHCKTSGELHSKSVSHPAALVGCCWESFWHLALPTQPLSCPISTCTGCGQPLTNDRNRIVLKSHLMCQLQRWFKLIKFGFTQNSWYNRCVLYRGELQKHILQHRICKNYISIIFKFTGCKLSAYEDLGPSELGVLKLSVPGNINSTW